MVLVEGEDVVHAEFERAGTRQIGERVFRERVVEVQIARLALGSEDRRNKLVRITADTEWKEKGDLQYKVTVGWGLAVILGVPRQRAEGHGRVAKGIGNAGRHGEAVEGIPAVGREVRERSGGGAVEAAGRRHLVVQDRGRGRSPVAECQRGERANAAAYGSSK